MRYRVTYNTNGRDYEYEGTVAEGTGATFAEALAHCVTRLKERFTGNCQNYRFYREVTPPVTPVWEEFTP